MAKLWSWIKNHKLIVLLILVILYLVLTNQRRIIPLSQTYDIGMSNLSMTAEKAQPQEAPPTTDVSNRMVIKESYLSLLVDNVVNSQKKIIDVAQEFGGYMVNSNLQNPQDAPTATVIVRLPSDKLNQALEKFRGLAIKVISENLQGDDVTDQYVDNEARLTTLSKTKSQITAVPIFLMLAINDLVACLKITCGLQDSDGA